MTPLIDADMLRYEVGFGVEVPEQDEDGNPIKDEDGKTKKVVLGFDACIDLLNRKVNEIVTESWATEEPVFYLTASQDLIDSVNKLRKWSGDEALKYRPNFRDAIAKTKPYKGNRTGAKPAHYDNLTHYIVAHYNTQLAIGIEADDMISIECRLDPENYIICSRDKDLRITPGIHYGWSCGQNPSFGPKQIDELGYLEMDGKGKLSGGGLMFFYSQMITGDAVDNIPGLPKKGPAFAFKLLNSCKDEKELFEKVTGAYKDVMGDNWKDYFTEQANLLWIIQSVDKLGEPVFYKMYDER